MKKILFTAMLMLLTLSLCFSAVKNQEETKNPSGEAITLFSSPDIMALATAWASDYSKQTPGASITVMDISGGELSDALRTGNSLGIVTAGYLKGTHAGAPWKEVIGREVIVGVMNPSNPMMDEIGSKGISAERMAGAAAFSGEADWSMLLGKGQQLPLNIVATKDASTRELLGIFLGSDISALNINLMDSPAALYSYLGAHPGCIGFCRLTDIIDPATRAIVTGLCLLPLDKNSNGQLDSYERIFGDVNALSRGIWLGKYPKELTAGIYSIAMDKPQTDDQRAFLKWLLTEGQEYLVQGGYWGLATAERQSGLEKLIEPVTVPDVASNNNAAFKYIIIGLIVAIIVGLIMEAVILYRRYSGNEIPAEPVVPATIFREGSVRVPGGLMYDKTHTWAFMEKDGTVRMGINDFLPHITGPLTGLRLKKPGDIVKKGEAVLTIIRNGKQLVIKAPVSGTITAHNKALLHNASLLNSSPYNEGWVYEIQPSNWSREIMFLFMADRFSAWIKDEFIRLKDFFAFLQKAGEVQYTRAVLQDGGDLREGILEDLGPEAWEDFQARFMEAGA